MTSKSPTQRRPDTPDIKVRLIDYMRDNPQIQGGLLTSSTSDMTDENWLQQYRRKNGSPVDSTTGEEMTFAKHFAILTNPMSRQSVPENIRGDDEFWRGGGNDDGYPSGVPKSKANDLRKSDPKYATLPPRSIIYDHFSKNERKYKRQGYSLDVAMPLMLTDRRSYMEQVLNALGVSPETLYGDGHAARFIGGFAERELMMRSRAGDTLFALMAGQAETEQQKRQLERQMRLHYGRSQIMLNYAQAISPRQRGITGGENPFEAAMANESNIGKVADSFAKVFTDFPSVLQFTYDNAGALTFDIAWHLVPGKVGWIPSAAYALMYGAESAGEAASYNQRGLSAFAEARARQIAAIRSGMSPEDGDIRQMYQNLDNVSGTDMMKGMLTSTIETVGVNMAIRKILAGAPNISGKISDKLAGTAPGYWRKGFADSVARGYNSLQGAGIAFAQQFASGATHEAFVRSGIDGQGWDEYIAHIIEGGLMEGLTLMPVGAVGGALTGGGRYKAKSQRQLAGLRSKNAIQVGPLDQAGIKFNPVMERGSGQDDTGGVHGEMHQAGEQAGQVNQEDDESPYNNQDVAEGRRIQARQGQRNTTDNKLATAGLPPVGTVIEVQDGDGTIVGEIVDMTKGGIVEIKVGDAEVRRVSASDLKNSMVADHGPARQSKDQQVEQNIQDQESAQTNDLYFASRRAFENDPQALEAYEDSIEQGVEQAAYTQGYKDDPPSDKAIWKMRFWWARKYMNNWNTGEALGQWAAENGVPADMNSIKKAWTTYWRERLMSMREAIQASGRTPQSRRVRAPNQQRVGASALAALDRKQAKTIIDFAKKRAKEIADQKKQNEKWDKEQRKQNEQRMKQQRKQVEGQRKELDKFSKRLEQSRKKIERQQQKKRKQDEKKKKDEQKERVSKNRFLADMQSVMQADGSPAMQKAARRIASEQLKLLDISTRGIGLNRALQKVPQDQRTSFLSRVKQKIKQLIAEKKRAEKEKQKTSTATKPAPKKRMRQRMQQRKSAKPAKKKAAAKTTKTTKKTVAKKSPAKRAVETKQPVRPKPRTKKANSIEIRRRARGDMQVAQQDFETPELSWFEKLHSLIAEQDVLAAYMDQLRQEKTPGWKQLVEETQKKYDEIDKAVQAMNKDRNKWKHKAIKPDEFKDPGPAPKTRDQDAPKGKTAASKRGPDRKKESEQKTPETLRAKDIDLPDVSGSSLLSTRVKPKHRLTGQRTILRMARRNFAGQSQKQHQAWNNIFVEMSSEGVNPPNNAQDAGLTLDQTVRLHVVAAEFQFWMRYITQLEDSGIRNIQGKIAKIESHVQKILKQAIELAGRDASFVPGTMAQVVEKAVDQVAPKVRATRKSPKELGVKVISKKMAWQSRKTWLEQIGREQELPENAIRDWAEDNGIDDGDAIDAWIIMRQQQLQARNVEQIHVKQGQHERAEPTKKMAREHQVSARKFTNIKGQVGGEDPQYLLHPAVTNPSEDNDFSNMTEKQLQQWFQYLHSVSQMENVGSGGAVAAAQAGLPVEQKFHQDIGYMRSAVMYEMQARKNRGLGQRGQLEESSPLWFVEDDTLQILNEITRKRGAAVAKQIKSMMQNRGLKPKTAPKRTPPKKTRKTTGNKADNRKFAFERVRNLFRFRGRKGQKKPEVDEAIVNPMERRDSGDIASKQGWIAAARDALIDLRLSLMTGYVSPQLYNKLHRWAQKEATELWDRGALNETYQSADGVRKAIIGAGTRGPKIIEQILKQLGVQGKVAVVMEDIFDKDGNRRVAAYQGGVISIDMLGLLGSGRLQDARYYVTHEVVHFLYEMSPDFRARVHEMADVARRMFPELAARRQAEYREQYQGRQNIQGLIAQEMVADVLLEQTFDIEYAQMMTLEATSFVEHTVELIRRLMQAVRAVLGGVPVQRTRLEAMHDSAVLLAKLRTGRLGEMVEPHVKARGAQAKDTRRRGLQNQLERDSMTKPAWVKHNPSPYRFAVDSLGNVTPMYTSFRTHNPLMANNRAWEAPIEQLRIKAPLFASLREFPGENLGNKNRKQKISSIKKFYMKSVAAGKFDAFLGDFRKNPAPTGTLFELPEQTQSVDQRAQRYAQSVVDMLGGKKMRDQKVLQEAMREIKDQSNRIFDFWRGKGVVYQQIQQTDSEDDLGTLGAYFTADHALRINLWRILNSAQLDTVDEIVTHETVHFLRGTGIISQFEMDDAYIALSSAFPQQAQEIIRSYRTFFGRYFERKRRLFPNNLQFWHFNKIRHLKEQVVANIMTRRHLLDKQGNVGHLGGDRSLVIDKVMQDLRDAAKEVQSRRPRAKKLHFDIPQATATRYSYLVASMLDGQKFVGPSRRGGGEFIQQQDWDRIENPEHMGRVRGMQFASTRPLPENSMVGAPDIYTFESGGDNNTKFAPPLMFGAWRNRGQTAPGNQWLDRNEDGKWTGKLAQQANRGIDSEQVLVEFMEWLHNHDGDVNHHLAAAAAKQAYSRNDQFKHGLLSQFFKDDAWNRDRPFGFEVDDVPSVRNTYQGYSENLFGTWDEKSWANMLTHSWWGKREGNTIANSITRHFESQPGLAGQLWGAGESSARSTGLFVQQVQGYMASSLSNIMNMPPEPETFHDFIKYPTRQRLINIVVGNYRVENRHRFGHTEQAARAERLGFRNTVQDVGRRSEDFRAVLQQALQSNEQLASRWIDHMKSAYQMYSDGRIEYPSDLRNNSLVMAILDEIMPSRLHRSFHKQVLAFELHRAAKEKVQWVGIPFTTFDNDMPTGWFKVLHRTMDGLYRSVGGQTDQIVEVPFWRIVGAKQQSIRQDLDRVNPAAKQELNATVRLYPMWNHISENAINSAYPMYASTRQQIKDSQSSPLFNEKPRTIMGPPAQAVQGDRDLDAQIQAAADNNQATPPSTEPVPTYEQVEANIQQIRQKSQAGQVSTHVDTLEVQQLGKYVGIGRPQELKRYVKNQDYLNQFSSWATSMIANAKGYRIISVHGMDAHNIARWAQGLVGSYTKVRVGSAGTARRPVLGGMIVINDPTSRRQVEWILKREGDNDATVVIHANPEVAKDLLENGLKGVKYSQVVWRKGGAATMVLSNVKRSVVKFVKSMPRIPKKYGGISKLKYRPDVPQHIDVARVKFKNDIDDIMSREQAVTQMERQDLAEAENLLIDFDWHLAEERAQPIPDKMATVADRRFRSDDKRVPLLKQRIAKLRKKQGSLTRSESLDLKQWRKELRQITGKQFASTRQVAEPVERGSLKYLAKKSSLRLSWKAFKTYSAYWGRVVRTRLIKRWHAGITLANAIDRQDLADNLRIVNGAQSVAEYAFRYYVPRVARDEKGRITGHYADKKKARGWRAVSRIARHGHEFMKMSAEYMILKHGQGKALSKKRAAELRAFAQKNSEVDFFADQWKRFKEDMLEFYVDLGHITRGEANDIKRTGVPLLRPLKAKDSTLGFQVDEAFVRDPIQALVGSLFIDIRKGMQDSALAELLMEVAKHEDSAAILTEIQGKAPPLGDGEQLVSVRHRGTTRKYLIKDLALMQMIQSMRYEQISATFQVFLKFKNIVSATATIDPTFMVRNFARDTVQSAVIGQAWQAPAYSTATGIKDFLAGNETYQNWLLQGGGFGGMTDVQSSPNPARQILSSAGLGAGFSAGKVARSLVAPADWSRPGHAAAIQLRLLWRILSTPSRAFESGTRINQFKRGLKQGYTPRRSVIGARYSSSDFADMGTSKHAFYYLFRMIPFLISSINGMNATYEAAFSQNGQWMGWKGVKNSAQARKVGITMSAMMAFAIGVWFMTQQDDEWRKQYEALNPYEKATHIHFFGIPDPFRENSHLKIPVPFQIGQVGMILPQLILDDMEDLKTAPAGLTGLELVKGALFLNLVPGLLQAPFNIMTNTNFFGNDIIPAHMINFPEHLKSHEHTPEMYKWASRAMKNSGIFGGRTVAPLHFQEILSSWFTNVWRTTEAVIADASWDQENYGANPNPRGARFGTGGAAVFTPDTPGYGWAHQQFWAMQKKARGVVDAVERIQKYNTKSEERKNVRRQIRQNRRAYSAAESVQELWRRIRPMRRRIDRINKNPDLTAAQKRAQVEVIHKRLNKKYEGWYNKYNDLVNQAYKNIVG